jgi:hypothetical protein
VIPISQSTLRAPPSHPDVASHTWFLVGGDGRGDIHRRIVVSPPFSTPLRWMCYLWTRVPRVRVSWAPFKCKGWVGGRGDRGFEPAIIGELHRAIRAGCCARPGWQVGSRRQRDTRLVQRTATGPRSTETRVSAVCGRRAGPTCRRAGGELGRAGGSLCASWPTRLDSAHAGLFFSVFLFYIFYFVFPISNPKPSLNLFWILNTS